MHINGINVHYYDRGSGDAVLFLHGWGSRFSVFQSFLDSMTAQYRVCALDLPGFGDTGEPPEAWSVDEYADFTVAFCKELGLTSVILIGHSNGGRISIKLANRKDLPFTISKIILVDSAGIKPQKTLMQKVRQTRYKLVKRIFSTGPVKKAFPDLIEQWRQKSGSADYRNASPRMRECLVRIVNEDLTSYLPGIHCPTLLIWGEDDEDTPLADAKIMEKLIPDCGLVALKNAKHYSFLDQSFTFGKMLDSFLNIKR